jgi:hypothetical protein
VRTNLSLLAALLPALVAGCYSEGRYDGAGVARSPAAEAEAHGAHANGAARVTPPSQPTVAMQGGEWACVPDDDAPCADHRTHHVCAKDGSAWGACVSGAPASARDAIDILGSDGYRKEFGDPRPFLDPK